MLIIAPYIIDNTLTWSSEPELGRWLDKWEFERADEWSRWLCRTVIKHYVSSNAFTISLLCRVRCTSACRSAQISFQEWRVDAALIHLSQQNFRVCGGFFFWFIYLFYTGPKDSKGKWKKRCENSISMETTPFERTREGWILRVCAVSRGATLSLPVSFSPNQRACNMCVLMSCPVVCLTDKCPSQI